MAVPAAAFGKTTVKFRRKSLLTRSSTTVACSIEMPEPKLHNGNSSTSAVTSPEISKQRGLEVKSHAADPA